MNAFIARGAAWGSLLALSLAATAGQAAPLDAVQADRLRIQAHLARVEQQLRATPTDELAPAARQARQRLLDELRRYREAGVFPRNTGHVGERRPYFIDDEGRACAVGALVQRSGHEALAERIDQAFHTDYVPSMQDAELVAWAVAHGFSVAELSLIQPTYCNCDGWNGGFGPGDGAGGAGGAGPDGADFFQPVCGDNGLTYWNECIAQTCGGVTIVATGSCDQEPPCELCGTGTRPAVVAECSSEGICNGIDSQPQIVPVSEAVATRWLELQKNDCESPSYVLEDEQEWRPSERFRESWGACLSQSAGASGQSGAGGDGGQAPGGPAGGTAPSDGDEAGAAGAAANELEGSGCACKVGVAPGRRDGAVAALLLGLLVLLGRRRTSTDKT